MHAFVYVLFASSLVDAPRPAPRDARPPSAPMTVAITATRDTGSVHRALRKRIGAFEDVWRKAWEKVQHEQHRYMRFETIRANNDARAPEVRRFFALDCYRLTPLLAIPPGIPVVRRPVASNVDRGAVCPMWLPPDDAVPPDEGEAIDLALTNEAARAVWRARDELLRDLDDAGLRYPEDAWIAGQRVRFLIDQRLFSRARDVAAGCRGEARLCTELLALAHYYAGNLVSADSALRIADADTSSPATGAVDCLGQDVIVLFDVGDAATVRDLSCADQQRLSGNLWWLSDPLWAVPGNERYVAHGIRRVQTRLRAVNERDERYVWHVYGGGAALRETVIRYGWPSYTYWPGWLFEKYFGLELQPVEALAAPRLPGYSDWPLWLGKYMPRDDSERAPLKPWVSERKFTAVESQPMKQFFAPYTTKEYTPDRAALVPAFHTLLDPFSLATTHYDLYNPQPKDPDGWWPHEHMALPARLLPLDAGQDIFWRRDTVVAYHLAVDNPLHAQSPAENNAYPAALVGGTSELDLQAFGQAEVRVGEALRLAAELPSTPLVLSAELFLRTQPAHALRYRYGVRPPPTLRAMGPAEIALSDLLFMRLPDRTTPAPHDPETAARYMAGSLTFNRSAPVAVYWESYGPAPGDTVEVTVGVRRDDARTPARVAAAALGLASSLRDSITVRWTEPDARRSTTLLSAWKPIMGRSLALDLGALPAGNYMLTVEMRTRAGTTVRSERRFELRE